MAKNYIIFYKGAEENRVRGWVIEMRVGVIGVNHKLANLKLREKLAKAGQKLFSSFHFNPKEEHFIVLSTCNRTEIYFSSEDLPLLHSYLLTVLRQDVEEEFDQKLYSFFGVDCFSHLTKVASGLDSAILGETEILGQVKVAYEAAVHMNQVSKELHFLFQKSLAIAKKIRTDLQLGRGMPDLEHAIFQIGKEHFSSHKEARILFIGASEINKKILEFFQKKGLSRIYLCNRSRDKARCIVDKLGIHLWDWSKLNEWIHFDWIIFGTKSLEYLINEKEIKKILPENKKLIMDLCVPRNVDPGIGEHSSVTLLNIDEINDSLKVRCKDMWQMLSEAENKINRSVNLHASHFLRKEKSKTYHLQFSA